MDLSNGYPRNAEMFSPPHRNPPWYHDNGSYQLVQLECAGSKFEAGSPPYQHIPQPGYPPQPCQTKQSLIRTLLSDSNAMPPQSQMQHLAMPENARRVLQPPPPHSVPPQVSAHNVPPMHMTSKTPVITSVRSNCPPIHQYPEVPQQMKNSMMERAPTKMKKQNATPGLDLSKGNKFINPPPPSNEFVHMSAVVVEIQKKDRTIKTLTDKIAKQDSTHKVTLKNLESIQKEKVSISEELTSAKKKLKLRDNKLSGLEEKLRMAEKEKEDALRNVESLNNVLRQREEEMKRYEKNIEELKCKISHLEKVNSEIDTERREVIQKLDHLEAEMETKESSLRAAKEKVCSAHRQLKILEKEKQDSEKAHGEFEQNTQVLQAVLKQKDNRIEALQKSLREKAEELSRKNEKLQKVQKPVGAKRLKELEKQLSRKEEHEKELQKKLRDEERNRELAERAREDALKDALAARERARESEAELSKERQNRIHSEELLRVKCASSEENRYQTEKLQRRVTGLEEVVREASVHISRVLEMQQGKSSSSQVSLSQLSYFQNELRAIGMDQNSSQLAICEAEDNLDDRTADGDSQNPPTPDISDYDEDSLETLKRKKTKVLKNQKSKSQSRLKNPQSVKNGARSKVKCEEEVRKPPVRSYRMPIYSDTDEDEDEDDDRDKPPVLEREEVRTVGDSSSGKERKNQNRKYATEIISLSSDESENEESDSESEKESEKADMEGLSLDQRLEKCGGLWYSLGEVIQNLQGLRENAQRQALLTQIEYRCVAFGFDRFSKVAPRFGKPEDIKKMREYLVKMIQRVEEEQAQTSKIIREKKSLKYSDSSSSSDSDSEKDDKMAKTKRKQKNSTGNNVKPNSKRKMLKDKSPSSPVRAKRQRRASATKRKLKFEDLNGKLIEHFVVDQEGTKGWYRGVVTEQGRSHFVIKYEFDSEGCRRLTTKKVKEDYDNGDLVVVEVKKEDFIGNVIENLWEMDEGKMEWSKGHVLRIENEKGDDPDFEVAYGGVDEGNCCYYVPLLKDYWKNEVRFLSIGQKGS